jgi:hypothetical protein
MKTELPKELVEILKNLSVDPSEVRSVYSEGNQNTPWVLRTRDDEQPWAVAGRAYQTFASLDAVKVYLGERQGSEDDVYELVPLFDDRKVQPEAGSVRFLGKIGQTVFCTAPEAFIRSAGVKEIQKKMAVCLTEAGTGDAFGALLPDGVKFFRLKKVVS